ncbi:MAG: ACP phosphodiesterase, partial [Oscillospiraceae bacterium]|nr:ACP phosphodiesterase [Oscillospiraceae bacterium]
ITTAGGMFCPEEYGFGYIKALAENFYGIKNNRLISAVGLDIDGADPEKIISEAIKELKI